MKLKFYNSFHIYCILPNSQENCFSSLESPRVQKLRKRPEYNHMHSLQNECKTNSVKKGKNYLSHFWRLIIFSVSFVTRMPGSTESSISSLGDCEVKYHINVFFNSSLIRILEIEGLYDQNLISG